MTAHMLQRRQGRRPGGERGGGLRLGHVGRIGKHPARDEDVSRLGPCHQGHHRARAGRARLGPRGLSQGGPIFQSQAARDSRSTTSSASSVPADGSGRSTRTRSPSSGRRAISRTARSIRSRNCPSIAKRPRRRPARRQLPGRLLPAVGRTPQRSRCLRSISGCPASRRCRATRTSTATRPRGRRSCFIAGRPCGGFSISRRPIGRAGCIIRRRFRAAGRAG